MSLLNSIDRDHVLTAMETWDSAGGSNYLLVRGGVSTHVLVHGGREYDAPAIAGIAHGLATGRTLAADDIPGGSSGAAKALTRLGFTIRDDSPPGAETPRRTPSGRTSPARSVSATGKRKPPRMAASDRPVALCPTCYLALPATGVCDTCG